MVAVVLVLLAVGIPAAIALALLLAITLRRKQSRLLLRATGLPGTEAVAREVAWQERHGRERNTVIG